MGQLTFDEKFEIANDTEFYIAIDDAQNGKPALQSRPFQTIGDRIRLIECLEQQGYKLIKIK